MFCRNCGNAMEPNQAVCLTCGTTAGAGSAFCPNCGNPVAPSAVVCVSCGVALQQKPAVGGQIEDRRGAFGDLFGVFGDP